MRSPAKIFICAAIALFLASAAFAQSYRTLAQIETLMQRAATDHPDIARMYDLGLSEQGRHIWALQITDNPDVEEDEPEFRYISTMHGDEWVGNEMCLYLIEHLTNNYGSDPVVDNLVDNIDIWIVPVMNPDGFVIPQRYNANGHDLNRSFPDPYTDPVNTPVGRPAEVGVIMNWTFASSFTLSANFHAGALLVNYPRDNNPTGSSVYTASPDDDLFIVISEEYSQYNSPMWNSSSFYHGISNGADWYAIDGGMQDWNYVYMGSNEVTIELSDTKIPSASQIPTFWNQNRDSMMAYMVTCLIGVRGIVTDSSSGLPLDATITVVGRDHEIYTDPDVGDYHRMLLPGTYDLVFESDGYDTLTVTGVVVNPGDATRLDVALNPPPQITTPNGGETLSTGVSTNISWAGGSPTGQFQVQQTSNYGDSSVVSDGFESGVIDPNAYSSGGDAVWLTTASMAHTGSYSAQSGNIDDDEVSWMTLTVGGGDVSFWYRVSSEATYDFFNFYIDGGLEISASGSGSWQEYLTTLPEGSHELKWEYVKDYSVSNYSDTVWIDDLTVTSDNTVWTDIIALTAPGASSTPWTPSAESVDCKVRVRTSDGAGGYGVWDESDAVFTVVAGAALAGDVDGDCDVDISDLALLLSSYGACLGDPQYVAAADLTGDDCVGLSDLSELLSHYGETCP